MLQNFGTALSREQMKNVLGGYGEAIDTIGDDSSSCNVYCGSGTGYTCQGTCGKCEDAGNGSGNKPGQDKLCTR